jgi:hypothetical protein
MKKALWWIIGILLSPVLLFAVLVLLLYLPPVQNWAVDKVAEIASEKTGMEISVGHVQLKFPLDLSIDDFKMINGTDTIADMSHMVVDVKLRPLLDKRVVIKQLEINDTKLNTNGFIDAVRVKGDFRHLSLKSRGIDLDKQTVEVNGARLEGADLDVLLRDSVPEDTTTTKTLWIINADSISIRQSAVAVHLNDSTDAAVRFGSLTVREVLADLGKPEYRVGSIDWLDGGVRYGDIDMPQLALHTGELSMHGDSISIPSLHVKTPDSELSLAFDMPLSFTDSISPGNIQLNLDAQLGYQDIKTFTASLPEAMMERWPRYPLHVKGQVNGNMQYMEFTGLDVELPTAFAAKADGFVANLTDMDRLRADVRFKAETQNLNFIMASLPRDVQRNYRIPAGLQAEGRMKADGANYLADVKLREGQGMVALNGSVNTAVMRYDAQVTVKNLNVHHFMPHDSIYTVTADINAQGQGTDIFSRSTTLTADARIAHIGYGHWNLDNMTVEGDIRNGRGHAVVHSRNELLNGTVGFDALMDKRKIDGTLTADINCLDFYRMGLLPEPTSISLCGHLDLSSDLKQTYILSGLINDLSIRDSIQTFRPGDIGILLKARPDTTYLRAQSGDFIVKFDASGNYERLLKQLTILGDTVASKFSHRIIDEPAMRRLLPTMKLHVESKRENPVATFLKATQNIEFKELLFDIDASPVTGLNGKGHVHSLTLDDTRLDTINFRITQREKHLSFGGQVRNNKKNPQFVFNALFDGVLQQRGLTLGLRYFDADDKMGVRLGAQAEMVDSGIRVHLVPERPTLGYKEFSLNKDNYILMAYKKKMEANINLLADDGTSVQIYSEESDPTALQDLTVSLNKFNLAEITSVIPYVPRMTGLLNGDYHVVQHEDGNLSVVGDMAVRNMTYELSPIGNISAELAYLQKEGDAHAIEARLMKDYQEFGILSGTYYNSVKGSEDGNAIDAKFVMERLPLSIINGFIPDQLFGLQGYGEGELAIKGSLSKPKVDGEVYLDSSYVESIPYGVTLRFDNDPVRIVNSKLLFDNFTVYAHNNNPLNIQGDIDFGDMERIMVNMRMRAKDYQIISAKENPNSIAYGKAFVNVLARMSGPLDRLSMRGRVEVLGSTDMFYVLRDSPLTTDNQLQNLVKFTDFSDTTQIVVERPVLNGFQMDLTVDVSNGAHITAFLNTDHSNYVDIMGGGSLRMRYNPLDDLQLHGRYTLTNGEMKYSLPVIPLKTFTIRDGSYIEFTGEPMNPTLNITATERTRAAVNSNGANRSVAFDCGVKITQTLDHMGVEFTLDAPEDMQLHSELQAMSVEQRGKLAVTMLTTGMYLADGNTGSFSMNSALSSFLNSEINNITGNALRTLDLSFGMDNSTDATGNSHTDYSFKFAKRFMNNRLKVTVGGLVSSGAELQQRNNSFFDNVSLEYRLDDSANKFVTLFYQNNSYDWLDGYTQKYGGGFTWRRKLQSFWDIFRFKDPQPVRPSTPMRNALPVDTLKTANDERR